MEHTWKRYFIIYIYYPTLTSLFLSLLIPLPKVYRTCGIISLNGFEFPFFVYSVVIITIIIIINWKILLSLR